MGRKPRVMLCNEASFLSTGFATYGLEVMKRLHVTGKYELFEYASYGQPNDQRASELPWGYMTAMPQSDAERGAYEANPINQFGEWKFEEACLKFRPDVVWDIRDYWMLEYQGRSPLRRHFHWAIMPTVDAAPQNEEWVATYLEADGVFTYSDWGQDVLREQSGGLTKLLGSAPPGADLDTYEVKKDTKAHRRLMGIDENALIVGTVMRNQKRKLYPDLLEAFAQFLREAPREMASRAFLYLHTSWPDVGWDIPRLIKETGLSGRIVMTYSCKTCGAVYPSFFADALATCRRCGQRTAGFPTSHVGVSRKVLAEVISLFDVYVQYANSEGFGMPQVEAAACGVPVMAVDYSAMSDVVRKLGGFPIRVQRKYREAETHCWRALPDNADLVRLLVSFFTAPQTVRRKWGYDARMAVERHYSWDRTAKLWEDHFDAATPRESWALPAQLHEPQRSVPGGLSNGEFVRWGITHVAGRPELADSYLAMRLTRDLNWGSTPGGQDGYAREDSDSKRKWKPFGRDEVGKIFLGMCEQKNHWERKRVAR